MHSALSSAPAATSSSDYELVSAVRAGDDRAFEELYARYRSRISSYIYGRVGDHARAEDLAQDVFISALRRLRATDRPVAFRAWIYEIAKNASIDEFRRVRRVREVPLQPDHDGPEAGLTLVSQSPTPESAVAHKQALKDLRGAFHGLSENHHKVLVMRELEGLSYSQIGERMGMSRPVVESTLFRARRRVTAEYDELVSGRRCDDVQMLITTSEPESLLKLGIRQRRQLARHLSHCQTCRRSARLAGLDESLFHTPGVGERIAALLPLPWLRGSGGGGGRHRVLAAQPLETAARYADIVASSGSLTRAVAALATLAVAGVGGGMVSAVADRAQQPAAGNQPPALTRSVASPTRPPHRHLATPAVTARKIAAGRPAHRRPARSTAKTAGGPGAGSSSAQSSAPAGGAPGAGGGAGSGPSSTATGSAPRSAPLVKVSVPQGNTSVSVSAPALPKVKVSSPKVINPPTLPSVGSGGHLPSVPQTGVQVPKVHIPGM